MQAVMPYIVLIQLAFLLLGLCPEHTIEASLTLVLASVVMNFITSAELPYTDDFGWLDYLSLASLTFTSAPLCVAGSCNHGKSGPR